MIFFSVQPTATQQKLKIIDTRYAILHYTITIPVWKFKVLKPFGFRFRFWFMMMMILLFFISARAGGAGEQTGAATKGAFFAATATRAAGQQHSTAGQGRAAESRQQTANETRTRPNPTLSLQHSIFCRTHDSFDLYSFLFGWIISWDYYSGYINRSRYGIDWVHDLIVGGKKEEEWPNHHLLDSFFCSSMT